MTLQTRLLMLIKNIHINSLWCLPRLLGHVSYIITNIYFFCFISKWKRIPNKSAYQQYTTKHCTMGKKQISFEIFSKTLSKTPRKSQDSVLKIGVDAVKIDSFPTVHWYKNITKIDQYRLNFLFVQISRKQFISISKQFYTILQDTIKAQINLQN